MPPIIHLPLQLSRNLVLSFPKCLSPPKCLSDEKNVPPLATSFPEPSPLHASSAYFNPPPLLPGATRSTVSKISSFPLPGSLLGSLSFCVSSFLGFLGMSYYGVLGVRSDSSTEEIRRAYRRLAMQWHPDRWVRTPSFYDEAKQKFQQILEAYSVLSDKRKRVIYDAGLYDSRDEEDEGFCDFMQEMVSLMAQVRREGMNYNLEEEFEKLVTGIGGSLESSSSKWCHESEPMFGHSKPSKRTRFEPTQVGGEKGGRRRGGSRMNVSGLGMCGSRVYCN